MVDKIILYECKEIMNKYVGSISDLPYELGNTFANLYLRFILHEKRFEYNENKIPHFFSEDGDIIQSIKSLEEEHQFLMTHIKYLPEYIEDLRKLAKRNRPDLYSLLVEVYLDGLKYRIKDAYKKNGIRRKIERVFHKKYVKEIPDLLHQINSVR